MKPKNQILAGIMLTCVAFIFFIYALEAKSIFPNLFTELTYFNIVKYVGYVTAVFGVIFLFAALILLSRMRSDLEALNRWREANRKRPDADEETIVKIVRFICLNCGKRITAEFNKKKDSVKCPHCQVANLIPEAAIGSAEDLILKKQNFPQAALPNSVRQANGISISLMKLLAWMNLVLLFAIGIYLLVRGVPDITNANIYWGLGLMYAGLNLATLLFVLSGLALNNGSKAMVKEESV